jgi:hypothetical protein
MKAIFYLDFLGFKIIRLRLPVEKRLKIGSTRMRESSGDVDSLAAPGDKPVNAAGAAAMI